MTIQQNELSVVTVQPPASNTVPTLQLPTRATLPIASPVIVVIGGKSIQTATTANTPSNTSGQNGIPLPLLTVAAIQTPVKQQSYTNCNVTVSWTRNNQDPNFDHVNIWFVGYHGSTNPQLMSAGTTSPLNFICDATKATVKVYAQTVNALGEAAPLQYAAACSVTLSGIVGAPPAPTISQALLGTATGYQFGFNQVVLPAGDQEVIANYNIYRSATANTFASASLLATLTPNPALSGAITFTDTVIAASGVAYYYWVTAVNTAGYESAATAAQSGVIAGSIGSLPPSLSTPFKLATTTTSITITTSPSASFTRADGTQVVVGQTSNVISSLPTPETCYMYPYWRESDQTLQFVKNTDCAIPNFTYVALTAASQQYIETTTSGAIPASFTLELWISAMSTAGALFDFSAPQLAGSTTASICQCFVTSAGEVELGIHNGSTWTTLTTSGANVLDSTVHHICVSYSGSATTGTIYVDGADTSDGTNFWTSASMTAPATTTGYWHFGFVAGLAGAPTTSNLYTSFGMSSIALYDAALSQIQAAAHLNAFTTLGETYWLAETAYDSAVNVWKLAETTGTTAADSVGSNTGTYKGSPNLGQSGPVVTVNGSPQIAFSYPYLLAYQQQFLRNRTPLSNSPLVASTSGVSTSSGGGTGGGSSGSAGRGGGYCFTGNTLIKTLNGDKAIADITPADHCITAHGTFLPVAKLIKHDAERLLLHHMGNGEYVTYSHKILRAFSWVNAGLVFPEVAIRNEPVYHIVMDSNEPVSEMMSARTERSFMLANGVIAHNNAPIK